MKEIAELEKEYRNAEAPSSNVVSGMDDELTVELKQSAAHLRNASCGFVKVEFQADPLIMGRVVNGFTLMVLASESDIHAIPSNDCIAIKDSTKEGQMQIVSRAYH